MGEPLFGNVQMFLRLGITLNLVLCVFNLMPIPPLDGSRILSSFSPGYRRLWETEQAPMFALIAFVGLFFFGGPYIFGWAGGATSAAVELVTRTFIGA